MIKKEYICDFCEKSSIDYNSIFETDVEVWTKEGGDKFKQTIYFNSPKPSICQDCALRLIANLKEAYRKTVQNGT